jgi:Flp pilus assembly pilin Flp
VSQGIQRRVRRRAIGFGRALRARSRSADSGMTTVEYAVGTLVAAALAAVLYRIVTGESILNGLTSLITRALGVV